MTHRIKVWLQTTGFVLPGGRRRFYYEGGYLGSIDGLNSKSKELNVLLYKPIVVNFSCLTNFTKFL